MARDFSRRFYLSRQWIDCRDAYRESVHGLCEDCLACGRLTPGEELHHIRPLTPDNISDPHVTLDWDNLVLLCHDCHMHRHAWLHAHPHDDPHTYDIKAEDNKCRRYSFDALGRCIMR